VERIEAEFARINFFPAEVRKCFEKGKKGGWGGVEWGRRGGKEDEERKWTRL